LENVVNVYCGWNGCGRPADDHPLTRIISGLLWELFEEILVCLRANKASVLVNLVEMLQVPPSAGIDGLKTSAPQIDDFDSRFFSLTSPEPRNIDVYTAGIGGIVSPGLRKCHKNEAILVLRAAKRSIFLKHLGYN